MATDFLATQPLFWLHIIGSSSMTAVNLVTRVRQTAYLWGSTLVLAIASASPSIADTCTQRQTDLVADRPDVTNSSVVVPVGSLQGENGVNLSQRRGAQTFDGSNSRIRLGIAPCLEVLADLPNSVARTNGAASSGFADVIPAVKWQISPVPGKLDLSMTAGVGFAGASRISGPGTHPYLQFPWSWELDGGWSLSGMTTNFFQPADPINKFTNQSTFVIEKEVGSHGNLFIEYVGNFQVHGGSGQMFNSGGAYHLSPTRQIDFHVAVGLNRYAPIYVIGLGYSFRLDGLF
jgi:Putative MetA-pathway of phenol degradation